MPATSRRIAALIVLIAGSMFAPAGHAQGFPNKASRIVIGFPPGGGIDIVARLLAPKLAESFGHPVLVENRAGAAGNIAMEQVARAPADGHTVFLGTTGNLAVNPGFYAKLGFDAERDFTPVTQLVSVSFLIFTNPQLPVKTLADLVAYAKANPGKVNFGTSGNGGLPHLGCELLSRQTGMGAVHVPYKGSAPAMTDLMGGSVQFMMDAVAIGQPHVKSGKLRAIATTGASRLPAMPDIPAVAETVPGFEAVNWYGVVAPTGTPREAIERWQQAFAQAMAIPDIREKLVGLGTEPIGSSPAAFGAFLKAESAKWLRVVREANIKPD